MKFKPTAIGVLLLVSAACGGAEPASPANDGTSSLAPSTTSSAQVTSSLAPTTSASSTTEAPDTDPTPLAIPRLDNGLPATFVAVTEGWEAVEVDTATGNIIRSLGALQRPSESDDEAAIGGAVQQVWRTADQEAFILSTCCEPAAGELLVIGPDETLTSDSVQDRFFTFAWTAAPSPFSNEVATTGLGMEVGPVAGELRDLPLLEDDLRQPSGVVAWGRDGSSLVWITNNFTPRSGAGLVSLSLDELTTEPSVIELDWVGPGQWLDGIGSQQSGNYVGFLNTEDGDPESPSISATEGVVFSAAGELLATFPVEIGSRWGGYDPSGKVLIYTDGANVVRWQGLGQSGALAEGFIHASW